MQESLITSNIEAKQKTEIEFWCDSEYESPNADSIHNMVNKVSDAGVFLDCLHRHQEDLITNGRVLELGWDKVGHRVYTKSYFRMHMSQQEILVNLLSYPCLNGNAFSKYMLHRTAIPLRYISVR